MAATDPLPEITARVPAAPGSVPVLRSVAAAVTARAGGSVDDVADLRLIVDEAAARLLRYGVAPSTLSLSCTRRGDLLELELSIDAPSSGSGRDLGWRILSTLADRVEESSDGSGTSIRAERRLGRSS